MLMNEECLKGHCKISGLKLSRSCSYNIIIELVFLTEQVIKNFIYLFIQQGKKVDMNYYIKNIIQISSFLF